VKEYEKNIIKGASNIKVNKQTVIDKSEAIMNLIKSKLKIKDI